MPVARAPRKAIGCGAAIAAALAAWPAIAAAQFVDPSIVVPAAPGDDAAPPPRVTEPAERRQDVAGDDARVDLRLTLSSFLYRESGDPGPALVAGGAAPDDASPVRRFFGDLRAELGIDRLAGGSLRVDGRVRQTSGLRFQAGARGGDEYELRALTFRRPIGHAELRLGRQVIDTVADTRIDGAALAVGLGPAWSTTIFGGAYPARGSRSLDTDYPAIRDLDGTTGAPLVPVTAGAAVSYLRPRLRADLGAAGIVAPQDVPGATRAQARRAFVTSGGYWRPHPALDIYHQAVIDVAGAGGPRLTDASLGVDGFVTSALELSLTADHVDTELYEIAARNLLEDPDPAAMGVVQNGVALVRVSQDAARLAASLAVARDRVRLSASGGVHRRPPITVATSGGDMIELPGATMADTTLGVVVRRGPGGVRVEASGSALVPVGDAAPSRSRGVVARLAAGKAGDRGELGFDVMVERFTDLGPRGACQSLDPVACYGTATSRAAQAGGRFSLRASRDWLLLFDGHVGVRDAASATLGDPVGWPRVLSFTAFARLQWRYR